MKACLTVPPELFATIHPDILDYYSLAHLNPDLANILLSPDGMYQADKNKNGNFVYAENGTVTDKSELFLGICEQCHSVLRSCKRKNKIKITYSARQTVRRATEGIANCFIYSFSPLLFSTFSVFFLPSRIIYLFIMVF